MATLGNPRNTIEILNKYKFVFQKKFGQNFLIDTHVLEKIIRAADITKDDFVLEIGPGIEMCIRDSPCKIFFHTVAVHI